MSETETSTIEAIEVAIQQALPAPIAADFETISAGVLNLAHAAEALARTEKRREEARRLRAEADLAEVQVQQARQALAHAPPAPWAGNRCNAPDEAGTVLCSLAVGHEGPHVFPSVSEAIREEREAEVLPSFLALEAEEAAGRCEHRQPGGKEVCTRPVHHAGDHEGPKHWWPA